MIVFAGKCSCCGGTFTWADLSQELSCLEAKNVGGFGQCRRGVQTEEHSFDQECEPCLAEMEADEGYAGGMEDEWETMAAAANAAGGKKKMSADDRLEDGPQQKKQRTN